MTQSTRQLPAAIRTAGGSDYYPATWVTVGAQSQWTEQNGDQKFGLNIEGPKDGWWAFRKDQLEIVSPGTQLQVELKTKPNKDQTGFYQDVVKITALVNQAGEIVQLGDAVQAGIDRANSQQQPAQEEGWRPGMEDEVQGSAYNYEDEVGPGPETHQEVVREVAEARQTHRPRTGPDWQDEPPSFHTWRERGIQKMSALKASVEWLNSAPERLREFGDDEALRGVYGGRISDVEELAWRLMRELADGKAVDHVSE